VHGAQAVLNTALPSDGQWFDSIIFRQFCRCSSKVERRNHVIEAIMNNEDLKNSAKGCDQRIFTPSPLSAMLVLIDSLPTTIDQQILRKYDESKRAEEALVERVRMTGALHGEVGVALVYRRDGIAPRLK